MKRDGDSLFVKLFVWLLTPFWVALRRSKGTRLSVGIMLPICDSCSALNKIEPKHVDFENFRMTILVHREFKKRVTGPAVLVD